MRKIGENFLFEKKIPHLNWEETEEEFDLEIFSKKIIFPLFLDFFPF